MLSEPITIRSVIEAGIKALQWWLGELGELLQFFRDFKKEQGIEFEVSNKNGVVYIGDGQIKPNGRLQNITLKVIDDAVLYRKIKLPAAAGKNITKVVGYEFNKYFPMNVDDAVFSCHIVQPGIVAQSIEVEIWAVSRAIVEGYLSEIRQEYNIEIKNLAITNSGGSVLISEDVLKSLRSNKRIENPRMRKVLNSVSVLLLLALLVYPILKFNWLTDTLEQEISLLEKRAKPIIEVRDKILEMERRFQYLIDRKEQNPNQVAIWSQLTKTVSNKAIIDRMSINGRNIQLEGKAPSVERLIKTLESNSEIGEVKIIGPVTTTNDNLYETMKISMTIKK